MAQLNDLLVLGSAKLINGLGILGTLNADSILPNITDTYVLGESGKRWKSAHIKSLVSDDINVTNYATIGAGQAATTANTGALRVSGGLSTTQKSYFGAEIATNSTITSSLSTSTHLAGNKGTAIINSTAGGAGYNMLAKMNSTNGVWTLGGWTTGFYLFYTANSVITAGTNSYTKQLKLLDESGNSSFPGTVTAPTFSGALSGNASTATTLQTARTINGTSFNGSANITTANWGTARTLTVGNTGKSVNGAGNVSWSLSEIGALPTAGGTMSGDISFATIASWPTVSGETYPIESKGLYWSGSSDLVKLFYRVVSSDGGKFIIQLGDSTDEEVIVENTAGTVYAKIGNGGVTANNFYGNATSATYLKDKTNGTATYLNYGASGITSPSWFAAWNGYELRAISPLETRKGINAMGAELANGYYGMTSPSGDAAVWIRTTSVGIIPYQSGGAGNGHGGLGTSSWYFSNAYIDNIYGTTFHGNAASASVLGKNTSCDYNISGVTWFDLDGTAGAGVKTNDTPTSAWWHILRFNHSNNNAYYTDLAVPFNANSLYYKRIGNGAVQNGGWVKVLDALNYTSVLDSSYVNVSGDTMSGNLTAPTYIATQKMVVGSTGLVDLTAAGTTRLYADGLAISNPTTKNDDAWIRVTGTGESDTFLEIATGDDAGGSTAEQIVVRQYGSSGLAHEIKLLDGSGNTYLKRLIMNGALNLANGTWNKAGDDAQFGDNNTAGSFAIQGLNGNTNLKMVTYGGSSYGTMTWDGSFFKFSNKVYSNGSLVMTSANFSLSGTTLTITTT